jgi:F420-non-reducing hydrogenase large subunit
MLKPYKLRPVESHFGGITNGGTIEFYDGPAKIIDNPETRSMNLQRRLPGLHRRKSAPWSYLKFPYLKQIGFQMETICGVHWPTECH